MFIQNAPIQFRESAIKSIQHAWILEELKAARIPFDAILGNHDSFSNAASSGLAARTPASSAGYCYSAELEKTKLKVLDSSGGMVPAQQLAWLQRELASADRDVLLACAKWE